MAGQTNWDQNTNVFDKALTTTDFTANTASGSVIFSSTSNPTITGELDLQDVYVSGNLTVNGTATLNNVISVTASYSSGSTVFGDNLVDTHRFTGSVFITGSSFTWNNSTVIASNVTSSMRVASASQALTASFLQGTVASASQAATSSKISILNEAVSIGTYYPVFAYSPSGATALAADASTYTYQPSTNTLTVTSALALGVNASSSISSIARETYDSSNTPSVDWGGRSLVDNSGNKSIDWGERELIANDGTTIVLNWTTPGSTVISGGLSISGSLTLNNSNISTAWTSYTPVWTTDGVTQPVINNGSLTGAYKQIGKTVFVRVKLNWGTTTTGGTGAFLFSLPVTASNADGIQFPCSMLDNGAAWYQGTVNGTYSGFTNRSAIIAQSPAGANSSQGVTSTFPFTWGSTDSIQFNGSYESI